MSVEFVKYFEDLACALRQEHGYKLKANLEEAIDKFDSLASPNAYYRAGLIYKTKGDLVSAKKQLEQAAEHGHFEAIFELGRIAYEREDYEMAIKYLVKGAHLGETKCVVYLGICFEAGFGVEQSDTTAVTFFQIAALCGDPSGMLYLAKCYKNGRGVEKNLVEAQQLLRCGCERGDARACYELGHTLLDNSNDRRNAIKSFLRAAELGDEQAIEWREKNKSFIETVSKE